MGRLVLGKGVPGGADNSLAPLLLIGFQGKNCAGGTPMSTASASSLYVLPTPSLKLSSPRSPSASLLKPPNMLTTIPGALGAVPASAAPISVPRTVPQGPCHFETSNVPSTMATPS